MRSTRRRLLAGAAAAAVLYAAALAYGLRDPSPVGYWRSTAAHARYGQAYAEAFQTLPAPTRTVDLRTSYGLVRVYHFGPSPAADSPPIVLLPGRSSGVPMWTHNLARFARERTVFAVDAIGDAGLSMQDRALESADDQAQWIDETLTALGLNRVHLVGHSFGGASAAGYALRHPRTVATLTLLEPILVLAPLRWQIYLDTIPSALPFLPDSWRRAGLQRIGGGEAASPGDPVAAMIDAAAAGFKANLPTPTQLTAAERARLTMPTFVALGGRSSVSDVGVAEQSARDLPHATVRVWPQASHSLPMEVPGELDAALSDFYRGRI